MEETETVSCDYEKMYHDLREEMHYNLEVQKTRNDAIISGLEKDNKFYKDIIKSILHI